jgi:hypothetical protein
MQGRAAAGAVRGLQPSIPGRSHAAQAVRARFAWTGTSAPRAWCCCCVLAYNHARAGALQPSIMGHAVRTDGPTGVPGQASAAQTVGARAWTGPSGPHGTVRRPASGHMRPCERAAATPEAERWRAAANGLTTAVRSRFASRQCTLLHEQDPRDRAVWSAACSSCHPGQWWASGLFCMAVVQLWCTCVLLLGLHPCVMLRGQRIRCGGSARTQWWAMLNRMQHDATACNQMQPATPGGTCDRRAVQVRCAWTFLTARRCVTACERVRCSNASTDSRKPSSSSAGYSRP